MKQNADIMAVENNKSEWVCKNMECCELYSFVIGICQMIGGVSIAGMAATAALWLPYTEFYAVHAALSLIGLLCFFAGIFSIISALHPPDAARVPRSVRLQLITSIVSILALLATFLGIMIHSGYAITFPDYVLPMIDKRMPETEDPRKRYLRDIYIALTVVCVVLAPLLALTAVLAVAIGFKIDDDVYERKSAEEREEMRLINKKGGMQRLTVENYTNGGRLCPAGMAPERSSISAYESF
ncbi:uncharacterized protein LOC129597262 [Paramacrobiotus metropolitanus]|uniref:uncharacterized protein LOC129597262 n=1 Tax=Paramacrobiotus metropolitanus TaxID=2943436 RepID=UPI002445A5D0|nr:uncharacterized protein LOC129597262 [Paramacrobiotus metropolitanus]